MASSSPNARKHAPLCAWDAKDLNDTLGLNRSDVYKTAMTASALLQKVEMMRIRHGAGKYLDHDRRFITQLDAAVNKAALIPTTRVIVAVPERWYNVDRCIRLLTRRGWTLLAEGGGHLTVCPRGTKNSFAGDPTSTPKRKPKRKQCELAEDAFDSAPTSEVTPDPTDDDAEMCPVEDAVPDDSADKDYAPDQEDDESDDDEESGDKTDDSDESGESVSKKAKTSA